MNSTLDDLVVADDASDLIDEQDKKDFDNAVEGMKQDRETHQAFRDEWQEHRRQHLASKSGGGGKRKKNSSRPQTGRRLLFLFVSFVAFVVLGVVVFVSIFVYVRETV